MPRNINSFPIPSKPFPYEKVLSNSDDILLVDSVARLSPFLSDGEYVLPDKTVIVTSNIDIGSNAIRISTGTVLRGFANQTITSSAENGVIRATGIESVLIMREINILSTSGECLNLEGLIEQQLNLFFCGLFGAKAGVVNGFDVQSIKQCFINAVDGFTLGGTTNKVFISQTPFYGIAGSAVTLASDLSANVADVDTTFFKFDAPGIGITAETGYTVGEGLLRGSLIDGTAVPLSGIDPGDVNWFMDNNTGIRDSVIAGQASLDAPANVQITAQGEYVTVSGNWSLSDVTERFALNGQTNELIYTGLRPALIDFNATFTVDPANNDRVAFRATKNGAPIEESTAIVEQGAGPGSSPRPGSVIALQRLVTGDRMGLAATNLEATASFDVQAATFSARG